MPIETCTNAPGVPVCEAELRWAVAHELALCPEDLVERRTRAGVVPEWREAAQARGRCDTPRMELRPFGEQDLGDIDELIADPDVLHLTRIPEPPPDGFARQWLDRYERGRRDGRGRSGRVSAHWPQRRPEPRR